MTNPFLEAGRLRKVAALVTLLQAHKIPATRVEAMTYPEWVALASKAKVKPPSADTQAAVIANLRNVEALASPYPGGHVAGIPAFNAANRKYVADANRKETA